MHHWSLSAPLYGAPRLRCWRWQRRPSPLRRAARAAALALSVTAACIGLLALGAWLDA